MKFTKMHGLGNDYIYVNAMIERIDDPSRLSKELSRFHFSIGSDGLILIDRSDKADFMMRIFNSDGSEAEMCGNGIRCVGKYVYDKKLTNKEIITIETKAGIKTLNLIINNGVCEGAVVNMGKPVLDPVKIPVKLDEYKAGYLLKTELGDFEITPVSMGNPHCIIFVDNVDFEGFEKTGAFLEKHPIFPNYTNVEFVEVIDRRTLRMRVWERGAAETLACGTGASATLVAAVLNGRSDREATVKLKGGDLKISWASNDGDVYMSGPATTVFEGEIDVR
ncbi:MAG: diaminopimelate epimerase [Christensenellales bacterium]|jgi:diaminopimelate epimerase